jgi:hypothetical protein
VATVFRPHPNNCTSTLASGYTAGSGSLVLAAGTGAAFGSTFPILVTAATAATLGTPGEINTIFQATGRTADTLTGITAVEGTTDRNYAIGDRVDVRWTSGLAIALEFAINAVENSGGITAGTIAPARLGSGTPGNTTWLRGDSTWGQILNYSSKSSGGTLLVTETFCPVNAGSGNVNVVLPVLAGLLGVEFLIVRLDATANTVTVSRGGTDLINNSSASVTIASGFGKYLRLIAGGGLGWLIVGQN